MGIHKDGANILRFIYTTYTKPTMSYESRHTFEELGHIRFPVMRQDELYGKFCRWDKHRIQQAVKYLHEKGMIDVLYGLSTDLDFTITDIKPLGIETVENHLKFIRSFGIGAFGFSLNVGR